MTKKFDEKVFLNMIDKLIAYASTADKLYWDEVRRLAQAYNGRMSEDGRIDEVAGLDDVDYAHMFEDETNQSYKMCAGLASEIKDIRDWYLKDYLRR